MAGDTGKVFKCPHCGDYLSRRQIDRHLATFVLALAADVEMSDDNNDLGAGGILNPLGEPGDILALGTDNDLGAGDNLGVGNDPGVGDDPGVDPDLESLRGPDSVVFDDVDPELRPFSPVWGMRRNPAVTIEDWPEPNESDSSDIGDEPTGGPDDGDRDPEYIERVAPLGLSPEDEPELTDEQLRVLLQDHLEDMTDNEWDSFYSRILSKKDRKTLELLATRLRSHFARTTWDDLRLGVCNEHGIPSESIAWRRLRILSNLETQAYDCCVNSCCCYLGKYADLDKCPFCKEKRYSSRGTARRAFHYTPLIPQLRGLFQNFPMATKLRYRSNAEYEPSVIQDVFDSENYRALRQTQVNENSDYKFFDNPEDIALGMSTDGFSLFKRQRRGSSTGWPIIFVNYNLHPSIRNRLENILCVGVIPGPRQCRDLNSFLVPLVEELLLLEGGVECGGVTPDNIGYMFVLHAFIIIIFGDIPAISKVMLVKGHNALTPCRACYFQGVLCQLERSSVYYIPLQHPDEETPFPIGRLLMRRKDLFEQHYRDIEAEQTEAARERFRRDVGINGRSVLAKLKSIDFPSSFPYDIMHLLYENLVPNMIRHWTGGFKELDQGTGHYQLNPEEWTTIGRLTAEATRTIPSAFVGTILNIAEDMTHYKAEAYLFWFHYMAPILLKGKLAEKYYNHMLLIREIMLKLLQYKITYEEIDQLQKDINQWVTKYEEYYYQHDRERLPACPLTIHALLHIPYFLRRSGPLWASWAFSMERFCGHLIPAIKNRTHPYMHLNNYVQRRAQMQIVSQVHKLPSLTTAPVQYHYINGVQMSSRKTMYPKFDGYILGTPVTRRVLLNTPLKNRLTKWFGVVYPGRTARELLNRIQEDSLIRYGRFRMRGGDNNTRIGDNDRVRTASLIDHDPIARDNSFVKYHLLPDRNARFRNLPDAPERQTFYGRLTDIYYVEFLEDNDVRVPYLLASVQECNTNAGDDATQAATPVVTYTRLSTPDIIHINTIVSAVGRIKVGNKWVIVDQSRGKASTRFHDDEGNEEYD